jgi:hypothetical protein
VPLGYFDDLLIVPLGIMAAVKLISEDIMADLRVKAVAQLKPTSKAGLLIVAMMWLALTALAVELIWPHFSRQ